MNAELAHQLEAKRAERTWRERTWRVRLVWGLGPATSLGGIVWALFQPERITLLHPRGQGFWWLFSEPPLWVVLVGVLFALVVAPGLIADLEEAEREA
jgi:hypothetical protein